MFTDDETTEKHLNNIQRNLKNFLTKFSLSCFNHLNYSSNGECDYTVNENGEALVVTTKEIGLEVNADKTKYMVMSRDRNAGRGHSVKTDNSAIERVEEFKYLGTTLRDQNSIQEQIKSS